MSKNNNENKNSWVTVFIYPEGDNGTYLHDSKESAIKELEANLNSYLTDEEICDEVGYEMNSDKTVCNVEWEGEPLVYMYVIPVYGEESEDFKKGGDN